jgi:hypothetical protein
MAFLKEHLVVGCSSSRMWKSSQVVVMLCALVVTLTVPIPCVTSVKNASKRPSIILHPANCQSTPLSETFGKIYSGGGIAKWSPETLAGVSPHRFYSYSVLEKSGFRRKSLSGPGSDLGYATKRSLEFLVDTIKAYKIESMIDIPCGDVNWQFEAWETDTIGLYLGADVTQNVIALNMERFQHHLNKYFTTWDFTVCPIPKYHDTLGQKRSFDLVHVRDVLQHLSLEKGAKAARHILGSGAQYVIATTFPNGTATNISDGQYFNADLSAAPFNFPSPVRCTESHPLHESDLTCLYKLPNMSP